MNACVYYKTGRSSPAALLFFVSRCAQQRFYRARDKGVYVSCALALSGSRDFFDRSFFFSFLLPTGIVYIIYVYAAEEATTTTTTTMLFSAVIDG